MARLLIKTTGQQQHLGTERPVNMAIVLKKKKRKILFLGKSVMKTFETSLCQ
jgi:hypothetical protein